MRRGFRIYLLTLLLLGVSKFAFAKDKEEGPVTLQCGDMTAVLAPEWAWNIKEIKYKEFSLLTDKVQMYSGTAVDMGGEKWCGSGFGDEKVGRQALKIDRKSTPFKPGSTYAGKAQLIYEKRSKIGVFKVEMTIELAPDEIIQTHEYKQTRSANVAKIYAFMYPFTNEFNLFSGQVWGDPDLAKRFDGGFYGENAKLLEDNIRWFGLFCTERHTGLVCSYVAQYKGEEEQTILLDKADVREFHFRPKIIQADKMEFTLRMKVVECQTGVFPQVACKIVGSKWGPDMGKK